MDDNKINTPEVKMFMAANCQRWDLAKLQVF